MIGDIVCYRNLWNGIILDELESHETGARIIHIQFVKNVYKQQGYDVIEYEKGMFTPSTVEEMQKEAEELEQFKNDRLAEMGVTVGTT